MRQGSTRRSRYRSGRGSAVAGGLLALAFAVALPAGADEILYDGIAAQVGGDVVLVSEVRQMAGSVEERMRQAGAPEEEMQRLRADVLDRLIEARLLEEVVERLELQASEREVDAAIDSIARDTGLTREQLEESVRSHGLTSEEYRQKIRAEIERSKVLNTMVRSRVRVEPAEIEALYQQRFGAQPAGGVEVHLQHIMVGAGRGAGRSVGQACAQAEEAADRLEAGEAFAIVARQVSDANPERGGDLGWIHSRELAGWMAPVVGDLEDGEVSDVIETRFGCHLLKLVDRRKFEPMTFDRARPALERILFRQKMEEEYGEWVDTLRDQTYIERKGLFRTGGEDG